MHNVFPWFEPLYLRNLHNDFQIEILYFKLTVSFEAKEWIIKKIVITMWLILETIWLMEVRMSKKKKKWAPGVQCVRYAHALCSSHYRCHCSWVCLKLTGLPNMVPGTVSVAPGHACSALQYNSHFPPGCGDSGDHRTLPPSPYSSAGSARCPSSQHSVPQPFWTSFVCVSLEGDGSEWEQRIWSSISHCFVLRLWKHETLLISLFRYLAALVRSTMESYLSRTSYKCYQFREVKMIAFIVVNSHKLRSILFHLSHWVC